MAQLSRLYPDALGCDERAVALDPLNSYAWTRVASSASFEGNPVEADAAFRRARHLASDPKDAYEWALQMYQPKWYGYEYPGMLCATVNAACSDARMPPNELLQLANSFSPEIAGESKTYLQIVTASKPRLASLIAKNAGRALPA